MSLALGLVLDVGHAGKPRPQHTDRGAVFDGRVEADLAARYVAAAEAYAATRGVRVHRIQPGPSGLSYSQRHREAVQLAQRERSVRWLYVQCHLNSASRETADGTVGHDARYGLVGYDPRSASGRRAAELVGAEVEVTLGLLDVIDSARAEAATGGWVRMLSTVAGIYAGPSTIAGICYEPAFIQSDLLERANVLTAIGEALVDGAVRWAEQL